MGLFDFLGDVAEVAVRVASLPVTAVADAVTLGGVLTDKNSSYTGKQLEKIVNKAGDAVDELVD